MAKDRFTGEESRLRDKMNEEMMNDVRRAAEVHRQTRQHLQKNLQPGMTMIEIWWVVSAGSYVVSVVGLVSVVSYHVVSVVDGRSAQTD